MKILGVITARKNSRRLKNKNKKILGGKPLIQYTFDLVRKVHFLCDVILSTDDKDILNLGKKNKIICPWLRPVFLSKDNSSSYRTVIHAYNWYKKNYSDVDAIFLFQPTSPFRKVKSVNLAFKIFKKNIRLRSVVSVSFCKKTLNFYPNGTIFINPVKELKKYRSFLTDMTIPIINNNKTEIIDINYLSDLKKAERRLKKKLN
jgi:N-acylneuraminate cytidylyltransferase